MWLAVTPFVTRRWTARSREVRTVRYRTVGDASCTGAVESAAATVDRDHRRGRRHPDHRTRRHPRPTTERRGRDGRPEARGLLLMADSLRFATAGSVDDGKSTLIGRLLYDSKSIFEDQLEAVERRQRADGRRATPTWRCSPTACGPSASRASRSTSPTATSPHRSGSSSSPTPRATSSTRATWSPAPRRPTWRVVLIDARKGVIEQSRRHAFLASLLRIPHLVAGASTRWTWSTTSEDALRRDQGGVPRLRHEARRRRPHLHPDVGAQRRQRRRPGRPTCRGTRARRCCTTSRRSTSRRTATSSTPASPCSTCSGRRRTSTTTTAATPAPVAGGVFKPGDEVVVLPSGFTSTDRSHRHARRAGRRGVRADVGDGRCSPTRSTSPAAT